MRKSRKYIENLDGTVTYKNARFHGWIAHNKFCTECKRIALYSEDYDAYFCAACDLWLEAKCPDPHCDYCALRPDLPSLASEQTNNKQDLLNVQIEKKKERELRQLARKNN